MTEQEWLSSENPSRMLDQLLTGEACYGLGPGSTRWSPLATEEKFKEFVEAVTETNTNENFWAVLALKVARDYSESHGSAKIQASLIRNIFGNPF